MVVNERTWRGTLFMCQHHWKSETLALRPATLIFRFMRQHHLKSETLALRLLYNIRYDIIIRRYCTMIVVTAGPRCHRKSTISSGATSLI